MQRIDSPSEKPSTALVIESLVKDLSAPSETFGWSIRFGLYWIMVVVLLSGLVNLVGAVDPTKLSLPVNLWQPPYLMVAFLWLSSFLLASRILYLQTLPGAKAWPYILSLCAMLFAIVLMLSNHDALNLNAFLKEMDPSVMPCGLLIAGSGIGFGTWIARRSLKIGVCSQPRQTIAWSFGTGGLAAATFMHLYCHHTAFAHVLVWHTLPILIISTLGAMVFPTQRSMAPSGNHFKISARP